MAETTGVVFHVMDTGIELVTGTSYKGKVTLHGVVEDLDLWDKVLEQLNGMELKRGRDFKSELVEVLRKRNEELEQTAEQITDDKDAVIQRLIQELDQAQAAQSSAEQGSRILRAQMDATSEELATLRQAQAALDELSRL